MAFVIDFIDGVLGTMRAIGMMRRNGTVCLMSGVLLNLIFGSTAAIAAWHLPQSVNIELSQQVQIEVDPDEVARSSVPAGLFGFNIPWMSFRRGYWRKEQVRPKVIAWLKPFYGAVYRYPGGEVSNWFEWQKAVGPMALRDKQYANSGRYEQAEFGFDEFLDFVKAVNGVPLVTVNLRGSRKNVWGDADAIQNNIAWVRYSIDREGVANSSSLPFCQVDKKCPVQLWELGNELDWGKDAWDFERYVNRAYKVGNEMLGVDPSLKLIAQLATAPWSKKGRPTREFDKAIGRGLGGIVHGYAYHPYYDGLSITAVNSHLQSAINDLSYNNANADPNIFVTEHARWPKKPISGDWQDSWGQTGNLGGAISVADYQLSQMMIPNVRAAMWHALGAWGPWQLFYVNPSNDYVYPNVVYWGLRVLRKGLLDDALKIQILSSNVSRYRGGYDVRAVFMRTRDSKRYSLMTVNRSAIEQKTRLNIPKWAGRTFNARHYFITGNSKADANEEGEENRVVMQDRPMVIRFDKNGQAMINLPAFSVSSFLFEPTIDLVKVP